MKRKKKVMKIHLTLVVCFLRLSISLLVMMCITVTQCQPENTHGEFQPSNRNELLPKSPPFHAKGRGSTDPITNALVQRYGRLREWFWTPSSLHSRA